jgi:sorbitol/mannitol transport system permease protein
VSDTTPSTTATTTSGGPGLASTNLAFLIYMRALLEFDVGSASAGGVIARNT